MPIVQQSWTIRQRLARGGLIWTALGLLGLVIWIGWWGLSWRRNALVHVDQTWIMGWRFLGLDFFNNYQATQHWLAGGDVYRESICDPLGRALRYLHRLSLPTFALVRLVHAPTSLPYLLAGPDYPCR